MCCSEGDVGDDPAKWYLSRLDELCWGEKFEQCCDAESAGALISHVSIVSVRLTSHQQLNMNLSIPMSNAFFDGDGFHVNSRQTNFSPVVNFCGIHCVTDVHM